jgi:alkylation response protein AidB-like acyl-CoA dehydrogenase
MSITSPIAPPTRLSVSQLLSNIADIADVLEAGAQQSEDLGRLEPRAAEALHRADLFKLWWPGELGGPEATVREGIEVIERVAEIDTSAAWNLAVCTLGGGLAGAYLSDEAVETIFTGESMPIAGQTAPVGHATPVEGGIELSGQWFFGSGIHLAGWVKAGAVIMSDDGPPLPVIAVVPAETVTIDEDSWNVAGLAGSGSYNYSMEDVFVPEGYWYTFPSAAPQRGGATYMLPIPAQVGILHAGFALGVAARSLREVTQLAKSKIRQFDTTTVANRPNFRHELGSNHAKLEGARLYTYAAADRLQEAAGTPEVLTAMREVRCAARHGTDVALDIATWAYRNGGGTALRLDHPLQRLLRDMLAATQHIFVDDKAYSDFGGVLLGIDIDQEIAR